MKMPSVTLKDQDKIAWGWVEFTDAKDIKPDHIITAYRLKQNNCKNKTCRRNCRGNPFCLSGLGEARLIESLNKTAEDTNSTLQKRESGCFVGLKNLGATCYVNSLLQLWFHNKSFRDAIYSWNPLEDPVEQNNSTLYSDDLFVPQTVIGHLQQLFALMCYSKCRYIDPSPLVESLRLDTSTQQDAQEFSKLFISLLENALRHQSLPHVRNLISDNFRGEYSYVTRCCRCLTESVSPSLFYELDLNVKGHNTLKECLAEFLQEEKLEGADCYSCTVCQTKQEACRFIKLRSLPPVLNLQLLRFVYDREKGQKKKLKTVIQFPEVLDMKEFVETDKEHLFYNLSAVLIHKGTRASSGHFIAYIKDSLTGTWNTFNDEYVEKLEGKKLKLEEEDPENDKKQKMPRLPKGCQSSTDAYMLVYTLDERNPDQNEVKLPESLQNYVDLKNQEFDEFCEEIVSSKNQGLEKKEEVLNTYKNLVVDNIDNLDEIDVISTDWLVSFLEAKDENQSQIDNSKLLCPHEKVDPCSVTGAKYISSATADILYDTYSGGPRLKMSSGLCEPCVFNACNILRIKAKTLEEKKEINNILKKRMGVDEPGFYVHKYCLNSWRTMVLSKVEGKYNSSAKAVRRLAFSSNYEASEESSTPQSVPSSVLEEGLENMADRNSTEGMVSPSRKILHKKKCRNALNRRKKVVTVTVPLNEIRECVVLCKKLQFRLNNPNGSVESKERNLQQCKQLSIILNKLALSPKSLKMLNHRRHSNSGSQVNSDVCKNEQYLEEKTTCLINGEGSQPLDNNEHFAVKTEDEDENKSENDMESDKAFNEAIMCPHGNLSIEESDRKLVPVRVWEIFKQYFPTAPSFTRDSEPCHQCKNMESKDKLIKQQYYYTAVNQKKNLIDLFHLRNRPIPGKTADPIYILPKQHFHQPWCAFLRCMTRQDGRVLIEPPVSLKVDMLLCLHGLLHYNPMYEEDLSRLVLVTQQEWDTLTGLYTTNHQATIAADLTTHPELCQSCFAARIESEQKEKLNYDRARLNIRMVPSTVLLEDEFSDAESVKKKPKLDGSTSPIPPELKKAMKSLSAPSGDVRRSARNRKVAGQKDVCFTVSSTLTLRELKQKITSQLAVAPFDQHLRTLDGKELHGDYNTLSDFGIMPNSTLLLQIDEPKENFDDVMEESSTPTEPEAGFKGTGLLQAY